MPRLLLPALLALLALPSAAAAAPVKISPNPAAVSEAGVATIEVANPNARVMRGKATLAAGGRTVATRTVRFARRSVTPLELRLGAAGVEAVRAAGGKATLTLKVGRAGGRRTTVRRALTLALPQPPAPQGPAAPAQPAPAPAPGRWAGRMGAEGPYDASS